MDPIISSPKLTLAGAQLVANTAMQKAAELGMKAVTVAVVDDGGHLLVLMRDRASYVTVEIAQAKARTAANFGVSSADLKGALKDSPDAVAQLAVFGQVAAMEGGEPLLSGRLRLGGIGVSGGSAADDIACAKAGAAALKEVG